MANNNNIREKRYIKKLREKKIKILVRVFYFTGYYQWF